MTRLEPDQATLLTAVMEGTVLDSQALAGAGVTWGTNSRPWGNTLI